MKYDANVAIVRETNSYSYLIWQFTPLRRSKNVIIIIILILGNIISCDTRDAYDAYIIDTTAFRYLITYRFGNIITSFWYQI